MNKEKLKKIFTKIGQINPEYSLEEQVYNKGKLIRFIPNPSEKVGLAAVRKNSFSIRFIKNPSEKVQLKAVRKNPNSIQYIKNPTQKVKKTALHVLSGGLFGP